MKQDSLKPGDVLEIFLPARDSSVCLNKDVVLIDRYTVTPSNLTYIIILNLIQCKQSLVLVSESANRIVESSMHASTLIFTNLYISMTFIYFVD